MMVLEIMYVKSIINDNFLHVGNDIITISELSTASEKPQMN